MDLGFGFIWMLLFWGGLIIVAIWLIGVLFPSTNEKASNKSAGESSALDILKTRYANGELTTEEYQEMLNTIQQERVP
jgi:putative membrane protein